jgi:hypothetical protein
MMRQAEDIYQNLGAIVKYDFFLQQMWNLELAAEITVQPIRIQARKARCHGIYFRYFIVPRANGNLCRVGKTISDQ